MSSHRRLLQVGGVSGLLYVSRAYGLEGVMLRGLGAQCARRNDMAADLSSFRVADISAIGECLAVTGCVGCRSAPRRSWVRLLPLSLENTVGPETSFGSAKTVSLKARPG